MYGRLSLNYPSCLEGKYSGLSTIFFYTNCVVLQLFGLKYSSSNPESMMLLQRALRLSFVRRSMATGHGHGHNTEYNGIKMVIRSMYIEYIALYVYITCIVFALELALKVWLLLITEISVIYGQRFLDHLSGKLQRVFIGITSYNLLHVYIPSDIPCSGLIQLCNNCNRTCKTKPEPISYQLNYSANLKL